MKQHISVKQAQGIHLTPQLLQSIRLLQLTAPQLELEVRAALERNPLLEVDEDDDAGEADVSGTHPASDGPALDVAAMDEFPDPYPTTTTTHGSVEAMDDGVSRLASPESSDYRVRILLAMGASWGIADRRIAAWWLDHCDDRGFLEHPLHEMLVAGAKANGVTVAVMADVRHRLLHGEWPGVSSVDLRECLLAQLRTLPAAPDVPLAIAILERHCDLISIRRLDEIAIQVGATLQAVEAAIDFVRSLSLSPVVHRAEEADYLRPDVVAWNDGREWHVSLADTCVPALRINALAENALASSDRDHSALKGMLDEARWLVRGIAMRNDTLLRTAQALVRRQRAFLDHGDEALVPLTLSDVASEIQMHESTISRVTVGKYIQTPRGPIELKHFFASRLDGSQLSGTAVRAMVKKMIDSEPAHAPLADATIASMLARNGIRIARRTVAKYREQLEILPARERGRTFDMTGTN